MIVNPGPKSKVQATVLVRGPRNSYLNAVQTAGKVAPGTSGFGKVVPRASAAAAPAAAAPRAAARKVTSARLHASISKHVDRLAREKHGHTGMVPIHEVRAAVRRELGAKAASHKHFDKHVLDQWRGGKVRILPINDATRVSPKQMNRSIQGNNETWFYLEKK